MAIKLIDACKQLNVNMSVVWHFCKQHGIDIVIDPCALIDDDLHLLLVDEFKKEPEIFKLPKPVLKNAPKVLGRIDLSEFDKRGISRNKSIKRSEIISRESAFQANDTELVKYLLNFWGVEKLEFEGIYTTENIDLTKVRGVVTDVTISDKHVVFPFTNADFNRISVRKGGELKNTLVPGRCSFLCKLAPLEVRKKRNEPFLLTIDLNTIHNTNEVRKVAQEMPSKTSAINHSPKHMTRTEQIIRARSNTNFLIGKLMVADADTPAKYVITDIRGGEGEKLDLDDSLDLFKDGYYIPYNGKPMPINEFYYFDWHIDELTNKFCVDGDLRIIDKAQFLHTLFLIKGNLRGKALIDSIDQQKMVFDETTGAEHTYLYELLQNANDYPFNSEKVKVKFVLTKKYLFFLHTGAAFDLKNIVAICSINDGNKRENKQTIGYKGIGFKSVFAAHNDYVYIKTGDWSFRFDEKFSKEQKFGKCAWSLMPIHTPINELEKECFEQLENADKEYRVFIAMRHETDASLNAIQLEKVFTDERILLFIPNLSSVDVYIDQNGQLSNPYKVSKDSDNWSVGHFSYEVPEELSNAVKAYIRGGGKIPEKFKDISHVNISFAVPKVGGKLQKMEGGDVVFNYLPTELSLGLGFLVNADFVPNASRSGLHTIDWNKEIMTQCGRYFITKWWLKFIETENDYDLSSAFDIIPDFNINDAYAKCFEAGFNEQVVGAYCIPSKVNDEYRCCKISEIVWDKIGLTDPENPILTDDEFYKFTSSKWYLPHKDIRKHNKVISLFERYNELPKVFSDSEFLTLCVNEDFKSWLKVEENNIRFLKFVIEKNYFSNLSNYPIFLSVSGELKRASELYIEDVDKYVSDLAFLGDKLPRLNLNVRNELEKISNWVNCKTQFKKFYDFQFAKDILNNDLLKSTLYTFENSISFLHFLAITDFQGVIPSDYPIYNEQRVKRLSSDKVYFRHEEGVEFLKKSWIDSSWASFIHSDYFKVDTDKVKTYIIKKFNISELDNKRCCIVFIENEKYAQLIAAKINGNIVTNLDFYLFLSKVKNHEIKFNDSVKPLYKILTTDSGGATQWRAINTLVLKQNESWESLSKMSWLPPAICMALSNNYAQHTTAAGWEELQSFLENSKIISSLGIKGLYDRVISKHSDDIFAYINTKEKSKEFLKYLYDFRQTFFGENTPDVKFKNIPIFCEGAMVCSTLKTSIYAHSTELDTLLGENWFDRTTISVCDSFYNDLFDGQDRTKFYQLLGLLQFDLKNFILSRVLAKINVYNEILKVRENNIKFHKYFASIHKLFTVDELAPLKKTPIYLQSPVNDEGELVLNSNNHYLPTALLNEIISNDLVPISIMDALHPDYISANIEKDYYVDKLQNTEIELGGFINYITYDDNKSEVYNYISEKERNIRFWRWVLTTKGIKYEMKEKLACFSLLSNNDTDFCKPCELYISDNYVWDGFEGFIKEFEPNAKFISALYLDDTTDKNEWRALFKNIKVTVDTSDLVANVLLPNLGKYKQVSVVKVLAEYTDKFKIRLNDEEDELRNQLSHLPLKCANDNYYIPSEALISGAYYNIDNNPMEMVVLPNLVSEEYLNSSPEENEKIKLFLRLIADKFKCKIDTETALFNEKVSYFLNHQNDYIDTSSHYEIISILANNYVANQYNYSIINKEVILKTLSEKPVEASKLYLSSIYHPNCDYHGNGIQDNEFEMQFVSEKYAQYSQNSEKFFKHILGIHQDFENNNLNVLENYAFAVYFWNIFAHRNDLSLICNEESLSKLYCIPTINELKRPKDVYDYRVDNLCKIVQKLERNNNTDLLPCVQFPSWLKHIGMRSKLYILECLRYLKLEIPEYRTTVIAWLSDTPLEIIMKYQKEIDEFSQSTRWLNGKKEWVQLSSLVAISRLSKSLFDMFHANASVCFIPELTIEQFNLLCKEILKVKILTDKDFIKEHDSEAKIDLEAKVELKKRLLYVLYTSGKENWEELYNENLEKIDNADICTCKQIFYKYDDEIQTYVKVYSESPDYLWYVGSWNGAMYGNVKEWLKTYVEPFKDVSRDFLDNILLDDFETTLNNYESELSESFTKYLNETEIKGFKITSSIDTEKLTEELDTSAKNPMAGISSSKPHFTGENVGENPDGSSGENKHEDTSMPMTDAEKSINTGNKPNGTPKINEKYNAEPVVEHNGENTSGTVEPQSEEGYQSNAIESTDSKPIKSTSIETDSRQSSKHDNVNSNVDGNSQSGSSNNRREPHNFTKEQVNNLRSSGSPLQLKSLDPTPEEIEILGKHGISPENIADSNYLAQLRLYNNLHERGDLPNETLEEFLNNSNDVTEHKLRNGKYIHACSAAKGVMYVSPKIWNKVIDARCAICVYSGPRASEFFYINSKEELLRLVEKDDVVIKITGQEKVNVVQNLYDDLLHNVNGTAYTLIRVAAHTDIDAVFARYVGAMRDENDGNDESETYNLDEL